MKTTLNPFENAKRTANGAGGVSPSVIEEMQAEISVLGSENASQAQDITDINDNLAQTPITVGGETLSTIDDKLNYLIENDSKIIDYLGFNFYDVYGLATDTIQLGVTNASYFSKDTTNPIFTVTKAVNNIGSGGYVSIILTARVSVDVALTGEYTEYGESSNYVASMEIKHNNTDIITKHAMPSSATTNTISQIISLSANDTITLNFYMYYGQWYGKLKFEKLS